MASMTYLAKRRIIGAHVNGNNYSIDFIVAQLTPYSTRFGNSTTSMGGNVSTVVERIEEGWMIETDLLLYSDKDLWREFEHSVIGDEIFTFDGVGVASSPVSPQQVRLKEGSFSITRESSQYMRIAFKVIVAQ